MNFDPFHITVNEIKFTIHLVREQLRLPTLIPLNYAYLIVPIHVFYSQQTHLRYLT